MYSVPQLKPIIMPADPGPYYPPYVAPQELEPAELTFDVDVVHFYNNVFGITRSDNLARRANYDASPEVSEWLRRNIKLGNRFQITFYSDGKPAKFTALPKGLTND